MPKWGMVIDLNKCTGCGVCVAACKTELNVAIVGPEESARGRTLFCMDIFLFYEGEYPNIKVRHLPRPCFHCEHPPCTKVCPVRATYLNEEGFVTQIYPQCIGCRYCQVACPYTVKYFNWYAPEWPEEMRASLNPDVSVRPVGVVEKCTFCVHRFQKAKEQVADEGRELEEGDYVPACVESCPTNAMYFGDLENPKHQVNRLKRSHRAFRIMEDLGTEPKVFYLSEVE